MTEDDAKAWLTETLHVSRETLARLDSYREMVLAETAHQNLIARSTFDVFWTRHIVDSAQLLTHIEGAPDGPWLDLGAGAGLPGIVLAILGNRPVHMVEERRGRIGFLNRVVQALALDQAVVHGCKVEALRLPPAAIITARAFAPLPKLFDLAHRFATPKTLWLLPKGRSAAEEVETARATWQAVFHVKQSITDSEAAILVAQNVRKAKAA
ncbi:MAG: 16S rRNA (guanine(527)-N(7))-methyltransferase RsmG [Alphaproteobacteria bacterium]|jgi:16S rRNA (guanine527-N7)-methyltransferase|nr:16S rRNA (guanine(527)-N(7))-methyltransferase RsmG [Alphaproteobacteria bacterium]